MCSEGTAKSGLLHIYHCKNPMKHVKNNRQGARYMCQTPAEQSHREIRSMGFVSGCMLRN